MLSGLSCDTLGIEGLTMYDMVFLFLALRQVLRDFLTGRRDVFSLRVFRRILRRVLRSVFLFGMSIKV